MTNHPRYSVGRRNKAISIRIKKILRSNSKFYSNKRFVSDTLLLSNSLVTNLAIINQGEVIARGLLSDTNITRVLSQLYNATPKTYNHSPCLYFPPFSNNLVPSMVQMSQHCIILHNLCQKINYIHNSNICECRTEASNHY